VKVVTVPLLLMAKLGFQRMTVELILQTYSVLLKEEEDYW
jgi:hypothetical protein